MKLIENILTENPCYKTGRKIKVRGLMLHSVGCPQPAASVFIKMWNRADYKSACVHGFIDGNTGNAYQTLPWDYRGWHCGSGSKGSGNDTHIGIEMCEPACIKYTGGTKFTCSDLATARATVKRTYDTAVQLFALLCKRYGLDPLADGVIVSHKEGHKQGIASNHGDPDHLWAGLGMGYTMDGFRKAVKSAIGSSEPVNVGPDKEIWDFFKSKGLNDYAVAGLMGNLYAESGLKAYNLQNTYNTRLGMTDEEYTAAVDNGSYSNFVRDGAGYGLAQWTFWSRKQALYDFAKKAGKSIGDLTMQMDFLWQELQGYTKVMNELRKIDSVRAASDVVLINYERPADQSEAMKQRRAEFGQGYYEQYAAEGKPSIFPNVPFLVKVVINNLNYRAEPSLSGKVKGQTGKGVFTIIEVQDGWGKLKSGKGWIYLENPAYCTIGA